MKLSSRANLLWGILFTSALGTLLHFFYEWTGENPFAALFSPINESVWEHMKLLFFPALLYTFFEITVLSRRSGTFLLARTAGLLCGMLFMVAAYFTYTGISGMESLVLDILIFLFSVILTFALSRFLETRCARFAPPPALGALLLLLAAVTFFVFTFRPPALPVFRPPDHSASSMIRLLPAYVARK